MCDMEAAQPDLKNLPMDVPEGAEMSLTGDPLSTAISMSPKKSALQDFAKGFRKRFAANMKDAMQNQPGAAGGSRAVPRMTMGQDVAPPGPLTQQLLARMFQGY